MSQSTSCCSESEVSSPVLIWLIPSTLPVVEKAQQEPQNAWFLTPVTAPLSTQLIVSGATVLAWLKDALGLRALYRQAGR